MNIKNGFRSLLLLIVTMPIGFTQTLQEAIQQSILTHPEILINAAQTMAAKEGVTIAEGAYYPTVDVNGSYGREWTKSPLTYDLDGNTSITLNRQELSLALVQNIFSGGAVVEEVRRNKFAYQSQEYKTLGAVNDMALNVTDAYLNVLLQNQLVIIAEKNLSQHKRLFKMVQQRSDAGVTRVAELEQARARVALAESTKINAEGNQREAQIRFRKFVGTWPENLLAPPIPSDTLIPKTIEQALQEALDKHPLVKSGKMSIQEAQAQRKVAVGAFMPKVDAVFSASRNRNLDGLVGKNFDNLGMIRVSYNLFKGGGDDGYLKQTAYRLQEAFQTRDRTIVDLKETIRLAFNSWDASTKRTRVLADYVTTTEKTKLAYYEQFQIGQRTLLDLLNTQSEETRAKSDYLQSKKDEIIARFRILNGTGTLLQFIKQPPSSAKGYASTSAIFNLPNPVFPKKINTVEIQNESPQTILPSYIPSVLINQPTSRIPSWKS